MWSTMHEMRYFIQDGDWDDISGDVVGLVFYAGMDSEVVVQMGTKTKAHLHKVQSLQRMQCT